MTDHPKEWPLQEAKARLSELVRIVESEGPKTITVNGKPKVSVVPVTGNERPMAPTVEELLSAFQSCPVKDFKISRVRSSGKHRGPGF